ncbi:Inherit from COG: Hydrolase (Partial), partial [Seminavis robusta]|eukprot:Sro4583_g354290.1 Inherit from COG: Hydrolase (209) ;mRNA; f:624-1251
MKTFLFHASLLLSLLQCVTVHALASSGATSAPKTAKPLFFSSHSQRHPPNTVTLTYLEINSWLLSANGVTILVDPLLEGPLDFGIPSLYQGKKRVIPPSGLTDALPPIDGILITQGLDDHAHVRTLQKIHSLDPTVPILAPPSAKGALKAAGFLSTDSSAQVQFLHHGDEAVIRSRSSKDNTSTLGVVATKGARVGPPWQRRENGYILR